MDKDLTAFRIQSMDQLIECGDSCDYEGLARSISQRAAVSDFITKSIGRLVEYRIGQQRIKWMTATAAVFECASELAKWNAVRTVSELQEKLGPLADDRLFVVSSNVEAAITAHLDMLGRYQAAKRNLSEEIARQDKMTQVRGASGGLVTSGCLPQSWRG